MTLDHLIPLSWGGTNYSDNKQTLCLTCHREKTALEQKLLIEVFTNKTTPQTALIELYSKWDYRKY
jgi:5-methylcytosine-specific restriction endonuclease McrA